MKPIINFWKKLSIAHKLNLVIGVMATLIVGELLTLRFAMTTLSAARALVGGESLWSKAQKDAVFSLQRYGITKNEKDFQEFNAYMKIPEGDHLARTELMKSKFDAKIVEAGFVQGHIHADDVQPIIHLLKNFHQISYLARAIDNWSTGDVLMSQLKAEGLKYHTAIQAHQYTQARSYLLTIKILNEELTKIEEDFSNSLGEGSRWLEHIILFLLTLAVLTVETVGITLAIITNRSISKRLGDLEVLARELAQGNFKHSVEVDSGDEIGKLTHSINQIGQRLENSYRDLEKRVEERTTEATNAVQMRDEFLSIASHELRTPLTSLSLELQMLSRSVQTLDRSETQAQVSKLSDKSLQQVNRLTHLLDELLDLTRIQVGKFEVNSEETDLVPIVRNVVGQFGLEASQHGSPLSFQSPHRLIAKFDPLKIEQVITNLISNAIKYGAGTPVEVNIEKSGTDVLVSVRDQGPGIPESMQTRIFERFERAETNPNVKGLGLGLYISYQIVQAHGGTLSVRSQPQAGTVFTVQLKVA